MRRCFLLKRINYFLISIFISSWFLIPSNFIQSRNIFFADDVFQFYGKLCQFSVFLTSKIISETSNSKETKKKNKSRRESPFLNLLFSLSLPISFIVSLIFVKVINFCRASSRKFLNAFKTINIIFLSFLRKILKFIYISSRVKGEHFLYCILSFNREKKFSLGFFIL